MNDKPKLLVLGYARHGKDTFCDILQETYGYTFVSSSMFCAEHVVRPYLQTKGITYPSIEACYEDRGNHRSKWFDAIAAYNAHDPARLTKEILAKYDIYAGLRNARELMAAKQQKIPDLIIWIDASKRLPPEPMDSCSVSPHLADVVFDNNDGPQSVFPKVKAFHDAHLKPLEYFRG